MKQTHLGSFYVFAELRDGSFCEKLLNKSDILLLNSDIHSGYWDDTFAIGSNFAIKKFVSLYMKLKNQVYTIKFPHPESLLKYHMEKQGLNMVDFCGAERGDVLELYKKCDNK